MPLQHDLRYAVRLLSRHPGATMVTVLALALGIGVNTAVFTAYKAMVARPLDARRPGEMVNLALMRNGETGMGDYNFSYPDYVAYRDSIHAFGNGNVVACRPVRVTLANAGSRPSQQASLLQSAIGAGTGLSSSGARNTEFALVFMVSDNYFPVLGVTAVQGRTWDTSPSVLISENYWQRRFAGDPAMLGKTIHLNGLAVTIIGIAPHDFVGTGVGTPAFWVPLSLEPQMNGDEQWLRDRENQRYRLFGRLSPGTSVGQAQAEMTAVAAHLRTLHDPRSDAAKPATALVWPGSPFPLPLHQYAGLTIAILLIMLAAGMVLVVACANVGSLQLARARSRQSELHTRLSLGASRLRLIRQLITESTLVGLLAGVLAFLFSWAFLKLALTQFTAALPVEFGSLVFDVAPDPQIFAYVFAISLIAGMLSGLAPAWESSRAALVSLSRATTASSRSRRLQDILVAAQVSLSLVLMVAGSMSLRSSIRSLNMETGYDTKHVLALSFQYPEAAKYTAARKLALAQELHRRLAALPGVADVTSARAPGDGLFRTAAMSLDQHVPAVLHYTYVQPNYFQTLGIPLLLGHSFGGTQQSVILSESAAKQLWPGGENPVGRSLRFGPVDEHNHHQSELLTLAGTAYEVIGIAHDKRGTEFDGSDAKEVYLPLADDQLAGRPILVRTQSDPASVMKSIDQVISSIDPDVVATAGTLEEMLRQAPSFITSSLAAMVASTVGFFGLLLASMGIYGTVSYIVVLRTREVGIRMAIGARKADVLSLILGESARPVLAGLLTGVLLSLAASYLARGLLFGLSTIDGVSLLAVSLLFLAIALLAAYPPARRAMRVDPVVALRYE